MLLWMADLVKMLCPNDSGDEVKTYYLILYLNSTIKSCWLKCKSEFLSFTSSTLIHQKPFALLNPALWVMIPVLTKW